MKAEKYIQKQLREKEWLIERFKKDVEEFKKMLDELEKLKKSK